MEPQKTQKSAKKKKVNKWIQGQQQVQQQSQQPAKILQTNFQKPTTQQQVSSPVKNSIGKMGQKYHIQMGSMIGSGFASNVYLGKRISPTMQKDPHNVCLKAIDLLTLSSSSPQYTSLIHQQIKAMEKFNKSEYIVNLYDVYESPTFCYLVMEFCPGGDLYKMLTVTSFIVPLRIAAGIIQQVGLGLQQIHEAGYIHRDLKTQNIFVTRYPQNPTELMKVKMGDLGFCVTKQALQEYKKNKQKIVNLGSPIYMSPQISTHQEYSQASDIYALGIIWYQLLHREAPWQARTEGELQYKKLFDEVKKWRQDIPEQTKAIILKCLDKQPSKRPKLKQILDFVKIEVQKLPQQKQQKTQAKLQEKLQEKLQNNEKQII